MWTKQISECITDESKRILLKGIPLVLLSTQEYPADMVYWLDYIRANRN